jgi:hypothetical protein
MQEQHVRYLLERMGGELPIRDIDGAALERLQAVEEQGRRVRADGVTRQLSGATVRKRLSTLRQALELQQRRGALERLPVFPEVPYRYRPSRARLYDHADYLRLLMALPRHRAEWRFKEQIARTALAAMGPRRSPKRTPSAPSVPTAGDPPSRQGQGVADSSNVPAIGVRRPEARRHAAEHKPPKRAVCTT